MWKPHATIALLLALAACAPETEPPEAEPAAEAIPPGPPADASAPDDADAPVETGDSVLVGDPPTWVPGPLRTPPADWTERTVDVTREGGVATLRAVRTGSHEGFVRVVFEFAERVPGYHLEYVDRPVRQCGSGEPVPVAGDAWLEVRLRPAQAHTEAGEPTVAERDRRLDLTPLHQLTLTCDFEADVTWVLGLATPGRYRVAEASGPPRLVVDVQR
jgi:hypothetical protein